MTRLYLSLILLLTATLLLCAYTDTENLDGEDLFYEICWRCHSDFHFQGQDRSEKGWELVVYRMQVYDPFTDEQAEKIIDYLVSPAYRSEYLEEEEPEEKSIAELNAEKTVSDTRATSEIIALAQERHANVAASGQPAYFTRGWNPGIGALLFAKIMGYVAVLCLIGLAWTGFRRKALGKRFRPLHRALTVILMVSLSLHVVIDAQEYGIPPVLWLWFGVIATAAVIASYLTGYLRTNSRKTFKAIHYSLGIGAFGLTILHWIWAWLPF
ncbi:MAG: hypothetical protein ACLFUS_09745 [Candidatus Sumerlaeia bacterium]